MREHLISIASGKPIVGVSWFTNSARNGFMRSIEIGKLVSLIPEDIFLVNLQYGTVQHEIDKLSQHSNVEIFSSPKLDITDDLDGLASLIMACDEIVQLTIHSSFGWCLGQTNQCIATTVQIGVGARKMALTFGISRFI